MHTIYTCTQGKIEPVNIGNFIPRIQQYGQHLSPRHYIYSEKTGNKTQYFDYISKRPVNI